MSGNDGNYSSSTACIFCRIIEGREYAYIVAEEKGVVAFLDRYPVNLGHTLVAPKTHYENVFDTPGAVLADMILLAQKIATAQRLALNATGVRIVMNNGKSAGQEISHAHLHVIPYGTARLNRVILDESTGRRVAQALRQALSTLANP
jgi:histidine triad (HIT) family protein